MTSDNPSEPFLPFLNGSGHAVLRPFRQFSTTLTLLPSFRRAFSNTPGQRFSNTSRFRVLGMIPHVRLSEYMSICSIFSLLKSQ